MIYQNKNWVDGEIITEESLDNIESGIRDISLENNIHNGYSVMLGGASPTFSDPYGQYVLKVTLPSNTMKLYNSSNSVVKESDSLLVSKEYELTNNSTLYWNIDTNEIVVLPFGTAITSNSVVLATNSYGVVSSGIFSDFYTQKTIQSQYKNDIKVVQDQVTKIKNENNIHNGYSVMLGGTSPTFSDLHGSYVITVTLPNKTIKLYNSSNAVVKESDVSLVSTSYELTNNSTLYWNVDDNTISVLPFGTAITSNSVVLATNSYGVMSAGVFAEFYNQNNIRSKYQDDFDVYLGGVGYEPEFLVYYNYSIDITLPKDNTFKVVNKKGVTSTVAMTGQKFTLSATKALWFDVDNKVFVISDFSQNRTNFVLLAYNNYGKITNGYFSKFFYKQSLTQNMKSYWRDYMPDKITQILEKEKSYNSGDEFIFITDTHWGDNEKQSPFLLENIVNNTGVQNVLFGGDIPRAYGAKEVIDQDVVEFNTAIKKYKQNRNYYPIIGNHDFTIKFNRTDDTGFTYGIKESYGLFGRELENYTNISNQKMYYYRDNTAQKIRYVFVNTEESIDDTISWGVQAKITQEQADWLVNKALTVPDGYQIFVVGHVPIHPELPDYSSQLDVLRKIFESVNNKINLSFDTGYGTTVNHDFSNTNTKVIAYLAGHCHKDTSKNDNGLLHITTGCDAHYGDDVWTRTPQTTSEQLFDVFFIDTENSKINTIRIGAGDDRSFVY